MIQKEFNFEKIYNWLQSFFLYNFANAALQIWRSHTMKLNSTYKKVTFKMQENR